MYCLLLQPAAIEHLVFYGDCQEGGHIESKMMLAVARFLEKHSKYISIIVALPDTQISHQGSTSGGPGGPHHAANHPRRLNPSDALAYLNRVRDIFQHQPHIYNNFLYLLAVRITFIINENYDIAIAMSSSRADPVLGHCPGRGYLNI